MKIFRRILLIITLVCCAIQSANAASFTIKRIETQGNQRLTSRAVLSYAPVHVGQKFDTSKSGAIIQSLFASGDFSNVQLLRRGNTLIVRVQESPVISQLIVTGNKEIDDKKLQPALDQLKIKVGSAYQARALNDFRQGLVEGYHNMGRYDVAVLIQVKKEQYNTVSIHVTVKEGVVTKVGYIRFSGNRAFSDHKLRSVFTLTTPGLLTFFSHHDRYSTFQLQQDLIALQNFYYNHGYLDFRVVSKQTPVSSDKRRAGIYIKVHEGSVYHISGYKVGGKYANDAVIAKMITVKPGQVFSRQSIVDIDTNITDYFASRGHAFPKVNAVPRIDRAKRTVFLNYDVSAGRRVYVRYIDVAGNHRTTGKSLRYQMRQLEGSLYSIKKIKESKRRMANLPYFKDITVTPNPVPGANNLVDLNYHVTEVSAGRASVQGGYSDAEGLLYGANISDPNIMGTGKFASIGFQRSASSSQYNVGYTNPYYTIYGMSRGFNLYYTHTTPSDVKLDAYTMDSYGGSVNYTLPLSEYNYLSFGYGYGHFAVSHINPATISPGAYEFSHFHHSPYNNLTGSIGLGHSTLDRAIFPMNGNVQNLSVTFGVPALDSSLSYYKAIYSGRWYYPLGSYGFVLHPNLTLGYGNGYGKVKSLPFFMNFYGGGIDTLPGYEPNSLGPQNPNQLGSAVGGNAEIFSGVSLIFPNGLSDDVRTSLYVAVGGIFQEHHTAGNPGNPGKPATHYESMKLGHLRGSAGLLVSWHSPFGIISLGYGVPFNAKGARTQRFGFTFGTSL
jgi:outer membrane protein insertion porin family